MNVLSKRRDETLDLQEPGLDFILPTKSWKEKGDDKKKENKD